MPVPVRQGLAAAAAAAVVVVVMLATTYDTVDLVFPGTRGTGGSVMVEDFGDEAIPYRFSYDGQEVYLTARFFPTLSEAADVGVEEYRLRRVLQPAITSVFGEGSAVVLANTVLCLLGLGLAVGGLTDLAARHGRSPQVGYAAVAAFTFSVVIGTTEPLAFGLGFVGLALADRRRVAPAIAVFALAGLGRETALVMAFAAAGAALLERRPRDAAALALVPPSPFICWVAVMRTMDIPADTFQASKLLGFLDSPFLTADDVIPCVVAVVIMAIGVVTWRDVPILALTAAGFLGCCLLYGPDSFRWQALPRISAAALAVGIAGLAGLRSRSPRETAGTAALTPSR